MSARDLNAPVDPLRLRDGTAVMIRSYQSIPRKDIDEAYSRLSPRSQYNRFLAVVPRLTDTMLHHLIEGIDGSNHIALVLVRLPDRGPQSIIGVGRIVRYPHEPTSADVAVTIRDEWQGRGAATALSGRSSTSAQMASAESSPSWQPTIRRRWPCCCNWGTFAPAPPVSTPSRSWWTSPNQPSEPSASCSASAIPAECSRSTVQPPATISR